MLAITTFKFLAFIVAVSSCALLVSCESGHRIKFHTMPILPRSLPSEEGTDGVTLQKRCQAHNADFGNGMQKRCHHTSGGETDVAVQKRSNIVVATPQQIANGMQKRCGGAHPQDFGNGMQKRFVPMKVSLLSCNDDGSGTKCKYGTKILDGQPILEPIMHQANALLMPTKHAAQPFLHGVEDESNDEQDDDDDADDNEDDEQEKSNIM